MRFAAPWGTSAAPDLGRRRAAHAFAWLLGLTFLLWSGSGRANPPPADAGAGTSDGAAVRLGEAEVFTVFDSAQGESAQARAQRISTALGKAAHEGLDDEVHVLWRSGRAHVYAGPIPLVALDVHDARRAGDPSLELYADDVAQAIREALRDEAARSYTADLVLRLSLAVLSALVAWYASRRVRLVAERWNTRLTGEAEIEWPPLVRRYEVIKPATLRAGLVVGISVARVLGQLGLAYGWLLFVLSLFPGTRSYVVTLSTAMLVPLSNMLTGLTAAVPGLLVLVLLIVAVAVALRFVALYFRSVERGETSLGWLAPELAGAAGTLSQGGVVVLAVLVASPVLALTLSPQLGLISTLVLGAALLAAVPLLAGVVVGLPTVFGRRVRVGDFVRVAGRSGAVESVGLTHICLTDPKRGRQWVAHLSTLASAVEVQRTPRWSLRVELVAHEDRRDWMAVEDLPRLHAWIEAVADPAGGGAQIERLGPRGAHVRLGSTAAWGSGLDVTTAIRLHDAATRLGLAIHAVEVVAEVVDP